MLGSLRKNKSWSGWELMGFENLFDWSDEVVILETGEPLEGCKDDYCLMGQLPRYPREGLKENLSKSGAGGLLRSASTGSKAERNSKVSTRTRTTAKKIPVKLIFKTFRSQYPTRFLLVKTTALAEENSDAESASRDSVRDIDEQSVLNLLEVHGDVQRMVSEEDFYFIAYYSVRAAQSFADMLDAGQFVFCSVGIPVKTRLIDSLYHSRQVLIKTQKKAVQHAELLRSLNCTPEDLEDTKVEELESGIIKITLVDAKKALSILQEARNQRSSFIWAGLVPLTSQEARVHTKFSETLGMKTHTSLCDVLPVDFDDLSLESNRPSSVPAIGIVSATTGKTSKTSTGSKTNDTRTQQGRKGRSNQSNSSLSSSDESRQNVRGVAPSNRTSQSRSKSEFQINVSEIRSGADRRTSVMIKNIPNKYTQQMVLREINERFADTYDFFYLPIDFQNKCNIGYAFINFADPQTIPDFYQTFNNRRWNNFNSGKICAIAYARIQGRDALISRFENSSIMSMEEECRPVIFDVNRRRHHITPPPGDHHDSSMYFGSMDNSLHHQQQQQSFSGVYSNGFGNQSFAPGYNHFGGAGQSW